jgi:hypothetical protein
VAEREKAQETNPDIRTGVVVVANLTDLHFTLGTMSPGATHDRHGTGTAITYCRVKSRSPPFTASMNNVPVKPLTKPVRGLSLRSVSGPWKSKSLLSDAMALIGRTLVSYGRPHCSTYRKSDRKSVGRLNMKNI